MCRYTSYLTTKCASSSLCSLCLLQHFMLFFTLKYIFSLRSKNKLIPVTAVHFLFRSSENLVSHQDNITYDHILCQKSFFCQFRMYCLVEKTYSKKLKRWKKFQISLTTDFQLLFQGCRLASEPWKSPSTCRVLSTFRSYHCPQHISL